MNPIFEAALQNLKTNALADNTRLGGIFTPNGMQQADKDATANASDRLLLKSTLGDVVRLGIGGTQMPPGGL